MPFLTLNAKRLKTKAKFLLLITFHFSLFTLLSGCSAIGSNQPAALQITSTPEAAVFLDGKHIGKTPFRSDQLKEREYLVKIAAGEASFTAKVNLKSGTLTVINRELNNNFLAQSGEILTLESQGMGMFINSMPAGAEIIIDGKLMGKTPAQIEEITPGDHKVVLNEGGYIKREFAVKTSRDFNLVADVTLASEVAKGIGPSPTPLPQPQKVEIRETPQGFLRVRSNPSVSSSEIGRVKPGDQLEVIQEIKDWVQIKFEGKQGWVSTQYTKKL